MNSDRSDTFLPNCGSYHYPAVSGPFFSVSMEASNPGYPVVRLQQENCRQHLLRVVVTQQKGTFHFAWLRAELLQKGKNISITPPKEH